MTLNPGPTGPVRAGIGNLLYIILVVIVIGVVLSYFGGIGGFYLPGGFMGLLLLLIVLRLLGII